MGEKNIHIAMYPWFAMGHLTTFLHISNKLAKRGHKITFFIPVNTIPKLQHFNLHPNLITFVPITVPNVFGLPSGAETTADIAMTQASLLVRAMDLTKPTIESFLRSLKPHIIFFDLTHWITDVARQLGIRSVMYCTMSPATIGIFCSPERNHRAQEITESEFMDPPKSFPSSQIKLKANEARELVFLNKLEFGEGVTFMGRFIRSFSDCDAIGFKACKEMEGIYCDYIASQYNKPVLLAGPVLSTQLPITTLETKWADWLEKFQCRTVIFCALGSECTLIHNQFQELVLGLELTGMPFLAALKPPMGKEDIQSALPEGFEYRTRARGIVHGGWVPQQLILGHPSIGCFVTHCGSGSLSEGLMNDCQMVLIPHKGDQFINARLAEKEFKVGVEVEKDEDGFFTRDQVCKAIKVVMEVDGGIGKEVKANHEKWRKFLSRDGLETSYVDNFVQGLSDLS